MRERKERHKQNLEQSKGGAKRKIKNETKTIK